MILCARLKQVLPGTRTIPEQISENKQPYYDALEEADRHYKKGNTNVTDMEALLEGYLANQLVIIHEEATGSNHGGSVNQPGELAKPQASKVGSRNKIIGTLEEHPVIVGGVVVLLATLATIFFA